MPNLALEWLRSRPRRTLFAIGVAAVLLYEAARLWYRPYVYAHGLSDFGVADTLGNSLGTIATVLVFASVLGRTFEQALFVLRAAAIAVIVYELAHPLLGKPVDPLDVVATVLAGVASELILRLVYRQRQTRDA